MTPHTQETHADFYSLGIAPAILAALDRTKIKIPTPIQSKAIPPALEGKDIIGVAQTGTGKTIAFAVPIIQRLAMRNMNALIVVPTRELAVQVDEAFRKLLHANDIRTVVIIGGASMEDQLRVLRGNPRIIIATPGRLNDHLERRTMQLSKIGIVVLDEADRMLDMGFKPQIEKILKVLPNERQTMLFSATIPQEIMALAARYMKLPINIEIAVSGTVASRVSQELFIIKHEYKRTLLSKMLEKYRGSVLIFARTKRGAAKVTRAIKTMGHNVTEIHSDRTMGQRRQAMEGFKAGRYRILVATDIAARGIDVIGIELVINYDLPDDAENYVHRIGRTGRAGHEGHAVSFATPDQAEDIRNIEKIIRTQLPISKHPDVPEEKFPAQHKPVVVYRSRRRGGRLGSWRRR
jgi:ATP-dependent RNA helicase RhlE